MSFRAVLPLLSLPLLLACTPSVEEGVAVAELTEAAPVPAPAPRSQGRRIQVDTSRSRLQALGAKVTASHDIVFDRWEGVMELDGEELTGLEITVQMDSLRANVEKLTGHLKSADFFDVATWPTARFVSSQITPEPGPEGTTHRVSGTLSMHGVDKAISFPARITGADGGVEASTEFVIDRKDFGIVYPGMPDDLIRDEVVLTVELYGAR